MVSNIEDFVKSIINDPDALEIKSELVCKEFVTKCRDIADLIAGFGAVLVSTKVEVRRAGTELLSAVLARLPDVWLSAQQIEFIVTFYCDRLNDHHTVTPATLTGLLAIVRMRHFGAVKAAAMMGAIFQKISVQSLAREDRKMIFDIIIQLCRTHESELKSMGSTFVYGLINAIDQEQDPRILLQIFEFAPAVLRSFPLHHLAEEMFEVFAVYFPVDFNPSPDDPANIKRDTLAAALAQCLAAHRDFSEYSVPLVLEKLDSELVVAKTDSLHLLGLAAETFNVADVEECFPSLWTALHTEIVSRIATRTTPTTKAGSDIVAAALAALRSLVRRASSLADTEAAETCLANVLASVFESIMGSLSDVGSSHFAVSLRIACTCAQASAPAAAFTFGKVMPLLLAESESYADDVAKTAEIYEHITQLLEACLAFGHEQMDAEALQAFQDKLVEGLNTDANLLPVCLECLSRIAESLTRKEKRVAIYERIDGIVLAGSSGVASQIKALLIALARRFADEVNAILLERWFRRDDDALGADNVKPVLAAIAGLAGVESFTDRAIEYLFRHIRNASAAEDVHNAALFALRAVLDDLNGEGSGKRIRYGATMLTRNLREREHSDVTCLAIVQCWWTIMRKSPVDVQSELYAEFMPTVQWTRSQDVYLVIGLLLHVSQHVDVGGTHFGVLLRELTRICISNDANETKVRLCQHTLCALLNKAPNTPETDAAIAELLQGFRSDDGAKDARQLHTLAWLAKGLLRRGHSQGLGIVETLIPLIDPDNQQHEEALGAFDILTATEPGLQLPVQRILHQQKLLHFMLKCSAAAPTVQRLRAFAYALRSVPFAGLSVNLTAMLPLLFKGLKLGDPVTVQIFVQTIDALIEQRNATIAGQLNSLIPVFLELSTCKASMKIRLAALQSLLNVTKYPSAVLVPFKQEVAHALAKPLDDPKRLVRNAAVLARNKWFLI